MFPKGHESKAAALTGALVSHDSYIDNISVLTKVLMDVRL
jgi:hypothetical protein